jgi:hypothetical protein
MVAFPGPGNTNPVDPVQSIRSYLAMAIQIGAPAYNLGDHRGCYEVYACTARMLLQAIKGGDAAKKQLKDALVECSTIADVNQQAWIMRHAFDAILDEKPSGSWN